MALITQNEPSIPVGASDAYLNIFITNNDSGAVYNSGEISSEFFGDLASQLHALPANQHYSSLDALMNDWNFGITPSGNVYNGWSAILGADGAVSLDHISGIPGLSYTQWLSTQTNSEQDMMALTLRVPLSQLELDGVTGYNPATDARIEIGTTAVPQAFVGVEGVFSYHAPGSAYHVVPEPGTALMLVAGAAAIGAKRLWNRVTDYFRK